MIDIIIDDEFRSLIPPLAPEEKRQLETNLIADGCREPLTVWSGQNILLDGHNRHEICTACNIDYDVVGIELEDRNSATIWMIKNQFGRRNLPAYVRAELALLLKPAIAAKAKENLATHTEKGYQRCQNSDNAVDTKKEIAKAANVSHDTIAKVEYVKQHVDPETEKKLRSGETSINRVYSDYKREEKKQEHAKKVKDAESKRQKRIEPDGIPNLVLADPAWRYDHQESENRAIENHYTTSTQDELVGHSPETQDDAILFMWTTAPKLSEGIELLKSWGFSYKTCAVWDKLMVGMGYWFRGQHEILLVGVKGKPSPTPECERISSVFKEARTKHSKKPICVYEWIERAFPEHIKLEMYCREPRIGWQSWGNEV